MTAAGTRAVTVGPVTGLTGPGPVTDLPVTTADGVTAPGRFTAGLVTRAGPCSAGLPVAGAGAAQGGAHGL